MEETPLTRNLIPHEPTLLDKLCCGFRKAKARYEIDERARLISVEGHDGPELVLRFIGAGGFEYFRLGNKRAELLAVSMLEILKSARAEENAEAP